MAGAILVADIILGLAEGAILVDFLAPIILVYFAPCEADITPLISFCCSALIVLYCAVFAAGASDLLAVTAARLAAALLLMAATFFFCIEVRPTCVPIGAPVLAPIFEPDILLPDILLDDIAPGLDIMVPGFIAGLGAPPAV